MDKSIDIRLSEILEATNAGKIEWKVADSAIRWTRQIGERLYVTTITRGTIANSVNYTISIQATQPNEVVFQFRAISSSSNGGVLRDIYAKALEIAKQNSSKIIDDLLKDL